jgi:oligopeptidase B
VVYAIAHVRGGGEMGREWYDQGRLEFKTNSFTDLIACVKHLIRQGYADKQRIGGRGGSAGGLLFGAVFNMEPELFRVGICDAPFVDVTTTMLEDDETLSVLEYEDWGDPFTKDGYKWISGYSPYDNVHKGAYPALFIWGGLNDQKVGFHEPLKWVQRLRRYSTSGHPILLQTIVAGHSGKISRYSEWRDEARILAFYCSELGISEEPVFASIPGRVTVKKSGTVDWFNESRGLGIIKDDEGIRYEVGFDQIALPGYAVLESGDGVDFEIDQEGGSIENVLPVGVPVSP